MASAYLAVGADVKFIDKIGRRINPFRHLNRVFLLSDWQPIIIRVRNRDSYSGPFMRYSYVVLPQ